MEIVRQKRKADVMEDKTAAGKVNEPHLAITTSIMTSTPAE